MRGSSFEVELMSMFGNYLKVAVRNLMRNRVYSAINILSLALGMAGCMWVRPTIGVIF